MHPRLPHLFEERGFIRARIAARRETLAEHGKAIERLSTAGDSLCSAVRWARQHSFELGLLGCVTLILRPKRLPRAFRLGKRAFILWRMGKNLASRLSFLRGKLLSLRFLIGS
jgi:hypothetical protein